MQALPGPHLGNARQQEAARITPGTFKTFAFKTHVPAYLDGGLADLPISDLAKIGGQPNLEEWLDGDTWEQAIDSGVEVGKHKAGQAIDAVGETADDALDAGREAVRRAEGSLQAALEALTRKFR